MTKRLLLFTVVVALALRLLNAIYIPGQGGDLITSDMQGYDRAALAFLRQAPLGVHTSERYLYHPLGSDTYHPPGFYYFLAAVYAVFGHHYAAVRIVQGLLGTATCVMIYLISKEAFGETAGLAAAAFAAVYPPLIFYSGVLLTETLSTCLLAGGVWLTQLSSRAATSRWRLVAASGLLLGLAALTRPVLLMVIPLALVWNLVIAQHWPGCQEAARRSLAMCLPVLLVIVPITVRNLKIHGEIIPIATNGGVNFFLGHGGSPAWKDQIRGIPADYESGDSLIGISSRTATEEEAYFYRLGWEYIREHPGQSLLDLAGKLRPMYWDSDYWPASEVQAHFLRTMDRLLWRMLLLPLSLLSVLWPRGGRARAWALLLGVAASSLLIPALFWGQTRFRVPFIPYIIALAAGTACEIFSRMAIAPTAAATESTAR